MFGKHMARVMSLDKLGTALCANLGRTVDLAARFNRADSHLDPKSLEAEAPMERDATF
jgi:hypothetical protein